MSHLTYRKSYINYSYLWRGGLLCAANPGEDTPERREILEWAATEVEAIGLDPTIKPGRLIFHGVICRALNSLTPPSSTSARP
jgi:hypothetical protein